MSSKIQQRCLCNNILYQANIAPLVENSETKIYYGICETTFKLKYANHKKSFSHRNCRSDTELSNKFWRIKDNKHNTNITWEILGKHQAYNTSSKRYSLCLNEKLKVVLHRGNNMLHRRTKILNKCRHKNKYALISYDSKDQSRFLLKVSRKCFTQNYCFQESDWLPLPVAYHITGHTDFP